MQKDTKIAETMQLITFNTELWTKQLGSYIEVTVNIFHNLSFLQIKLMS